MTNFYQKQAETYFAQLMKALETIGGLRVTIIRLRKERDFYRDVAEKIGTKDAS